VSVGDRKSVWVKKRVRKKGEEKRGGEESFE